MRAFDVTPGVASTWPGISDASAVVVRFLTTVRVTGDPQAARALMSEHVLCHQVTSEEPRTLVRTPDEYAEHVRDMVARWGRFDFRVTELLSEGDHVYVRWEQSGAHLRNEDGSRGTGVRLIEIGSAVYRVHRGRLCEYWVQLDRLGLDLQIAHARGTGHG